MEIIINLTHDIARYDPESQHGTLKNNMFGAEDFNIYECGGKFYVDFGIDDGAQETVWTYPCKFTDHGLRLVVTIE